MNNVLKQDSKTKIDNMISSYYAESTRYIPDNAGYIWSDNHEHKDNGLEENLHEY